MKSIFAAFSLLAFSANAMAVSIVDISCRADERGLDPVSLTVQLTMGASPETKIDYKGNKISVGFAPGDEFEPQQMLVLDLNGFTSRTYDPKPSLYMLETPNGVRIQCFIKN